jgi:dienelactone hydrolase
LKEAVIVVTARRTWLGVLLIVGVLIGVASAQAAGPAPTCTNPAVTCLTGASADGATFKIEVPVSWNGTLLLYSHGYVPPMVPNGPAEDAPDRTAADELLARGYALAGSSYASNGWAVKEALTDQIDVLDRFRDRFGRVSRTIAWGQSMGGMITAGLVQRYPHRLQGALPMCGILGGSIGLWNQNLDLEFALKTLLSRDADPAVAAAAGSLQLAHVTDGTANAGAAEAAIAGAHATPQGRARLALASALFDLPDWLAVGTPRPSRGDLAAREAAEFGWLQIQAQFIFGFRQEIEQRAGGNPTWNVGVDYRKLLARSSSTDLVAGLYRQAGLSLRGDLAALAGAPRVKADRAAAAYFARNIVYDGRIDVPVLSIHTTGDGLVVVPHEQAYADAVRRGGDRALLRQLYVDRPGHCTFTDAEMLSALGALTRRLDEGRWRGTDPPTLNAAAAAYGPAFQTVSVNGAPVPAAPGYVSFQPPVFLRPFDFAGWGRQPERRGP